MDYEREWGQFDTPSPGLMPATHYRQRVQKGMGYLWEQTNDSISLKEKKIVP